MGSRKRADVDRLYADAEGLMGVFNEGTDLACVLTSASYLDASLASLLERHCIPGSTTTRLLDNEGVLGALAARSDVAYSLGLISKPLYQNARLIAQIRNAFAHHHLALNFEDRNVADLVGKLMLPSLAGDDADGLVERMAVPPRSRYTLVAAGLVLLVLRLASEVERVQPSQQIW